MKLIFLIGVHCRSAKHLIDIGKSFSKDFTGLPFHTFQSLQIFISGVLEIFSCYVTKSLWKLMCKL